MWRSVLRLGLLVTLALLGLSEGQALVLSLQATSREREERIGRARALVERTRAPADSARRLGGPREAVRTLRTALPPSPPAEAELFDADGRLLAAFPGPASLSHRPNAAQERQLQEGAVVTLGPLAGPGGARLLSYVRLPCCPETLRLASGADELVALLQEQRRSLGASVVRVAVLLLAALLALLPQREPPASSAADRALLAYQEAVTRLQAGRAEEHRHHEQDRQRMEAARQDLESMARAGELTAGIVHEVRNGLGSILGNARLLREQASNDEQRALAAEIRGECESLEAVVRRFVEFARRESLAREACDVRRLLERVIAREAGLQPVGVEWRHEGPSEVYCDEALLERALENLVRNACEAAGPSGRLEIVSIHVPPLWRLEIGDDGPGFGEELLDGAPRPFFTTKPRGLGLGLALATKIVKLHGGTLALRARRPSGALVIMELPSEPRAAG